MRTRRMFRKPFPGIPAEVRHGRDTLPRLDHPEYLGAEMGISTVQSSTWYDAPLQHPTTMRGRRAGGRHAGAHVPQARRRQIPGSRCLSTAHETRPPAAGNSHIWRQIFLIFQLPCPVTADETRPLAKVKGALRFDASYSRKSPMGPHDCFLRSFARPTETVRAAPTEGGSGLKAYRDSTQCLAQALYYQDDSTSERYLSKASDMHHDPASSVLTDSFCVLRSRCQYSPRTTSHSTLSAGGTTRDPTLSRGPP
ncbi:hypothetical protein C8T65DRAFT_269213 [Cerioporus squamosus]|nr:hypothetical protein C8T65DRAFT_269213 [Cerioporus squamosus]